MNRYMFFRLMEGDRLNRIIAAIKSGAAKARQMGEKGMARAGELAHEGAEKAKQLGRRGQAAMIRGKDKAIDRTIGNIKQLQRKGPGGYAISKLRKLRTPRTRKPLSMMQRAGQAAGAHRGKVAAMLGTGAGFGGGMMFMRRKRKGER